MFLSPGHAPAHLPTLPTPTMLAAPRLSQPSPVASLLVRVAPMATRAISLGLQFATSIPPVRKARTPPTPSFSRSPGPPLRHSAHARSFSARAQSSPAEPAGRGGADGRTRAGGCAGLPVVHHALFSAPQLAARHRFPMGVFEAIHAMLLREGVRLRPPACTLTPPSLLLPHPCCFPFLHPLSSLSLALHHPLALQVHCEQYLAQVCQGALPSAAMRRIGFPWSPTLVRRTLAEVAGTLETAQLALEHGLACSTAGGTHHAFRAHGSGYCILNDLAVTAAALTVSSSLHPSPPPPPPLAAALSPTQEASMQSQTASLPLVLPAARSAAASAAGEGEQEDDVWRELLEGAESGGSERAVMKRVQRVAIVDLDVHQQARFPCSSIFSLLFPSLFPSLLPSLHLPSSPVPPQLAPSLHTPHTPSLCQYVLLPSLPPTPIPTLNPFS
ncbi:unnamed protein product [Closterium sp. Naga37s-1]|nr:unnamed protein product [Closterium sp. Naga37s-1]